MMPPSPMATQYGGNTFVNRRLYALCMQSRGDVRVE